MDEGRARPDSGHRRGFPGFAHFAGDGRRDELPGRAHRSFQSAALGAALQAAHGWLVQAGKKPKWEEVVAGFTNPVPHSEIRPYPKAAKVYGRLIQKYARCERGALQQINRSP